MAISKDLLCDQNISWSSVTQVFILGCILAEQNKEDNYFSKGTLTYIVGQALLESRAWITINGGYQGLVDEMNYLLRLHNWEAKRQADAVKLAIVGGIIVVGVVAAYKSVTYLFNSTAKYSFYLSLYLDHGELDFLFNPMTYKAQ